MSYNYPEIRNFTGLFLQRNSFNTPDGALEVAENIIVSSDNILSLRRGNYTYFDPDTGTLNNLFNYQDKLLAIYNSKIRYYNDTGSSPNETGSEQTITGQTVSVTNGRISRSVEANDNFYFTTDNSPLKLTAYNSIISKSGAPQGLDLSSRFAAGFSTILGEDNVTGYRILFGYLDANDNLIIGAPSSVNTITNVKVEGAVASAAATVITVTQNDHGLVSGMYLIFSNATGFTTSANANGTYVITVTGVNTFTYTVPVGPGGGPGTVDYNYACPIRVEATIPSEITTALPWFFQLYRATQQSSLVGIEGDYRLVVQRDLTSAEIAAGLVFITDNIPEDQLGELLYTNENSREGELQANFRAPLCEDMTIYKGFVLYGCCTTRQAIELSVIDPTVMVSDDYVEVKVSATTRRYVARTGLGNDTVNATVTNAGGKIQINVVGHNLGNNYSVYISNIVGSGISAGTYYVGAAAADNFQISLTPSGTTIAYTSETALDVEGVTNGTYPIFTLNNAGGSPSVRLADTAQGLVKAINRDPSSLIYAQYTSSPIQTPGMMFLQSKGFGEPIYLRANTTTAGGAFFPTLPASFSVGTQVYSRDDYLPHAFFASKFNEPEAIPLVNFYLVGTKNKPLQRIIALRDSVIIIKGDGVFRATGDNLANLTITPLDKTVICVAPSSASVLNNNVIFLSNQGVCLVTESSIQIISRQIEDVIQPILGQPNLATYTGAITYETARLYLLTTTSPNDATASKVYCYNILTDAWTTWDTLFTQGVIGPNDNLFFISSLNTIKKERKKQTKLDYTDQNLNVTIDSVGSDGLSAVITSAQGIPQAGDVIVKNDQISRIVGTPVGISGVQYSVAFETPTNLVAADNVILYGVYTQTIKFAPFHAGLVGRGKQFAQFQVHFRDDNCSKLTIYFTGDTFGTSEFTNWVSEFTNSGWGLFPWGFAPWGQQETINLKQGTYPAPMCRTYIPLFAQRTTFIQAVIIHSQAAEPMQIQAVSYAVRAYSERVSK